LLSVHPCCRSGAHASPLNRAYKFVSSRFGVSISHFATSLPNFEDSCRLLLRRQRTGWAVEPLVEVAMAWASASSGNHPVAVFEEDAVAGQVGADAECNRVVGLAGPGTGRAGRCGGSCRSRDGPSRTMLPCRRRSRAGRGAGRRYGASRFGTAKSNSSTVLRPVLARDWPPCMSLLSISVLSSVARKRSSLQSSSQARSASLASATGRDGRFERTEELGQLGVGAGRTISWSPTASERTSTWGWGALGAQGAAI
jgi:hypothetical protein